MPFYAGETLERRLMRRTMTLEDGVAMASRVARAVDALPRLGVVHRDVKPDNILLLDDGG